MRLSDKLVTVRRLATGGVVLLVLIAIIVVWVFAAADVDSRRLAGDPAGVFGWLWWLIGRRVRSYGYVERADDLLVTSGILFRRLVVVPYGRLQLVDVVAGPLDRAFGIATVRLHTAAATTDATIPGLTPDNASGLRDRLAARGESRGAGL